MQVLKLMRWGECAERMYQFCLQSNKLTQLNVFEARVAVIERQNLMKYISNVHLLVIWLVDIKLKTCSTAKMKRDSISKTFLRQC